jgi:nucleoid-associated protein YgaU
MAEQMYAAGSAIRPLPSARRPFGGLRHLGRWLLVSALIVLASLALARVALGGTAPATVTVVVQPGDSLWSIAAARYPGADTRERVDAIERLNGLSSPVIVAGETLQLPSS